MTSPPRRLWLDLTVLVIARLLVRAGVALALGRPPNDDLKYFDALADAPLAHLLGNGPYPQYPPGLGLVLAPLRTVLPVEDWIFAAAVLAEVALYAMAWPLLRRESTPRAVRGLWVLGAFTAPATAVWAQDEIFAVLPLAALALFPVPPAVYGLIAAGTALALKQFAVFLLPLAALGARRGRDALPWLAGAAAVVLLDRAGDFVPSYAFSVSTWAVWPGLDPATLRVGTLALTGIAYAAVEGFVRRGGADLTTMDRFLAFYGLLLTCFYHVNPEYFVLWTVPIALAWGQGRASPRTALLGVGWFANASLVNAAFALGRRTDLPGLDVLHTLALVLALPWGLAAVGSWVHDRLRLERSPRP